MSSYPFKIYMLIVYLLVSANLTINALAPESSILEQNNITAVKYQSAVKTLAKEMFKDSSIPLNRIEKKWRLSKDTKKNKLADKLFSFFRLRDFHHQGKNYYFFMQLENNESFAYHYNAEKDQIAIISTNDYLNSLKKGNLYKRTPWAFLNMVSNEINEEIVDALKYPTTQGDLNRTFLNSTASALQVPRILDVIFKASKAYADVHRGLAPDSQMFTEISENVREKILSDVFDAPTEKFDIIFSYNTSEANNRLIRNIDIPKNAIVATTIAEHHSTYMPPFLKNTKVKFLDLDKDSYRLDIKSYEKFLKNKFKYYQKRLKSYPERVAKYEAKLKEHEKLKAAGKQTRKPRAPVKPAKVEWIFIAGANNVPGGINDIKTITEIAHKYGAKVLIDAAQLAPHEEILMNKWDVDAMTFSGHKASGEMGAIITKKGILNLADQTRTPDSPGGSTVDLVPLADDVKHIRKGKDLLKDVMYTAGPNKLEPGSPATLSFIKLGAAMKLLKTIGWYHVRQHEKSLTWYAFQKLKQLEKKIPALEIKVIGSTPETWSDLDNRLGVITFDVYLNGKEISDELLNAYLSYEWGINIRNGCFCAHPFLIHVKNAQEEMKETIELIKQGKDFNFRGSTRLSIGIANTEKDIDTFIKAIETFSLSTITYHENKEVTVGENRYSYSGENKYFIPEILNKRKEMIRKFEKDMYLSVNPEYISLNADIYNKSA